MQITTKSDLLFQQSYYEINSSLRNIYKGYSPKVQVKTAEKGNKHA